MSAPLEEEALIALAQWLGRALQYSVSHPSSLELGVRAQVAFDRALAAQAVIELGVLKDEVMLGDAVVRHAAIKTRLGGSLHARGVLILRFLRGVGADELTRLVELLAMPAQAIFDRGGIVRLALERGLVRVQLEEIAHDITAEERESQNRRAKLRTFFRDMLRDLLAKRGVDAAIGEHLAELLRHPEIAVTILEEDAAGIAEAAAGLALMTEQEEKKTGVPLGESLRKVFLALAPLSRDRLLLGFPALVGEFRRGLTWALEGLSPDQLARFAFPSVRFHASELDIVLYALTSVVSHDGTRVGALRRLALSLFDLPSDDASADELIQILARPVPEHDSFRREREVLAEVAGRVAQSRAEILAVPAERSPMRPSRIDGRRVVTEVVSIATRTRSFDRFCRSLPEVAAVLSDEGEDGAVLGLLRSLGRVDRPEWREGVEQAMRAVANVRSSPRILVDLEAAVDAGQLEDVIASVKLFVRFSPHVVLDRLDACDNRKLRRIMLDALPHAGNALIPLLREKLRSPNWYVVRNSVQLLAQSGCTVADVIPARRHPDERVRLEVIRALRSLPHEQATMDVVASYVTDSSQEVRHHANMSLRGELLGPSAISELEKVAADDKQAEELRLRIVHALGQSSLDTSADALGTLLQSGGLIESGATANVRDAAAVALHRSRAPKAKVLFEQGLASSARRVRKACQRAAEGG